jgi:hypothetical protein
MSRKGKTMSPDNRGLRWQKEAGLCRSWMIANRPNVFKKIRAAVKKIYPLRNEKTRARRKLKEVGL